MTPATLATPATMSDTLDCSIIITCHRRLDHLRLTLPAALGQRTGRSFEVIVVDYNDDQVEGWLQLVNDRRLRVVKVDTPVGAFNKSHANNRGAMFAAGRTLIFADADVELDPGFLDHVCDKVDAGAVLVRYDGASDQYSHDIVGTCAVRADAFHGAGAYDEAAGHCWGPEDQGGYGEWAKLGRVAHYDNTLLSPIQHGDDRRNLGPGGDRDEGNQSGWAHIKHRRSVNPFGYGEEHPATAGVVTACDAGMYRDLELLVRSVHDSGYVPIAVADLGLTAKQRRWLTRRGCWMIKPRIPAEVQEIEPERRRVFQWSKPWLIAQAPWRWCLWLDADTMVLDKLEPLLDRIISDGLQTFADLFTPMELSCNPPRLYELLPTGRHHPEPRINAGVVGLDRVRDAELLREWMWGIEQAAKRPEVREATGWHDQGHLRRAMVVFGVEAAGDGKRWNRSADDADYQTRHRRRRYTDGPDLFDRIRENHPGTHIVHWMDKWKARELIDPEPKGPVKAVLAGVGRIGGQMLMAALKAHPEVEWRGELNNPDSPDGHYWPSDEPDRVRAEARRLCWSLAERKGVQAAGFRMRLDRPGVSALAQEPGVRVIYLYRRDALAWVASIKTGQRFGWGVMGPRPESGLPTFEPTPEEVTAWLDAAAGQHRRFRRAWAADHDILPVTYEALTGPRAEGVWHSICDFLGVRRTPWDPGTVKQETRPIRDVLTNYDQLREALEGVGA